MRLGLSERSGEKPEVAPWIGPLVALGGMASKYVSQQPDRQLIIAISVPSRDFAATLIGCGWILSKSRPVLKKPLDLLTEIPPGEGVRLVTTTKVIHDTLTEIRVGNELEVKLGGGTIWMAKNLQAVAPAPIPSSSLESPIPPVGSLARWGGINRSWPELLATADRDLAIIGTLKWLREDLSSQVTLPNEPESLPEDSIGGLLLPSDDRSPTALTELHPASRLADLLPLSSNIRAAVLDGGGAIKYVADIESPLVVCVLDRSAADESPAEVLMQLRSSRGRPVSLKKEIGWHPPAGIEALAFKVAL